GLNSLGARSDDRLTDADFRKLNLYVSRNQALGDKLVARVRAMAQVSEKRLPSAEQLALGGDAFGRAFSSAYVVGDSGAAVLGELAWLPGRPAGSEIYGFVDWGTATTRARFGGLLPRATYDLSSAGAGV